MAAALASGAALAAAEREELERQLITAVEQLVAARSLGLGKINERIMQLGVALHTTDRRRMQCPSCGRF